MSTCFDAFTEDKKHGEQFNISDLEVIEFAKNTYEIWEEDLISSFREARLNGVNVDLREYVLFELFDREKHSLSDCAKFISDRLHWPIVSQCCDMSWFALTEDKFLTEVFLKAAGIATPNTLAVVDRTIRSYPGKMKIRDLTDLREFLTAWEGKPFFGKLLRSMSAYGAFLCDRYDSNFVYIRGKSPMLIDDFFENFIGKNTYVFQEVIYNHEFFGSFTQNLATLRLVILVFDNQVNLAFSVLKIPAGLNVVDSALRVGNYVCEVDGSDGSISSIVTTGPLIAKRLSVFPDNGEKIIGKEMPFWKEVMTIAANTAVAFSPVRLQSLDIAITKDGPVVIEVNTGASFNMIQRANGRGFLQSDVMHLLNVVGAKFDQLEPMLPKVRPQ